MKPFLRFFVLRLALFFLPVALLLSFPAWVLWVSGEWTPVDTIVHRQQVSKEPLLVGLAYSNPAKYYKLRSLLNRHAKIVVFGSSHVMAFREEFFSPQTFYNAAVGGSRLPDFENFIAQIPEDRQPKVLIVGLDPFFALPDFDWSQREEERFDRKAGRLDAVRILGTSWKDIYRDAFSKKFSAGMLMAKPKDGVVPIGLEAVVRGNGFLNDGAYFNKMEPAAPHGSLRDYSNLKGGETYDERGLLILERFLNACQKRGIHVIGILPPVREGVYEQILSSGYSYWQELPHKLEPLFKSRGFSVYDFSRPSSFGGNDSEFYDDFHGTEGAYERVAAQLYESEPLSKA